MAVDLKNIARKGALAYVGAIAMTGDQVSKAFGQLVERGAQVEHATRMQVGQATRTLRGEMRESMADSQEQVAEVSGALAQGRDRLLDTLNIPTHADVQKLNLQVDRLSGDLEALRKTSRRQKADAMAVENGATPLPGYEKLNAEAIVGRLAGMEEPALLSLRSYEQAHGNRITVLRAVERTLVERQAARGGLDEPATHTTVEPLPRYDELTAEEIVERLGGLDPAELLHVKVYELEHANRVTVLRAVAEKLTAETVA